MEEAGEFPLNESMPMAFFPCALCDRNFYSKQSLQKHLASHDASTDLRCEACDLNFQEPNELKMHIRVTHQLHRLECKICGQTFGSRSGRNSHMKSHFQDELRKCEICGKGFSTNSRLQRHMVHHSESSDFICRLCGQSYKYKSSLERHQCKVPVPNQMCTICCQILDSDEALKEHMQIHEPEGRYPCSKCGKIFRWLWSHERHVKQCGNITSETENANFSA